MELGCTVRNEELALCPASGQIYCPARDSTPMGSYSIGPHQSCNHQSAKEEVMTVNNEFGFWENRIEQARQSSAEAEAAHEVERARLGHPQHQEAGPMECPRCGEEVYQFAEQMSAPAARVRDATTYATMARRDPRMHSMPAVRCSSCSWPAPDQSGYSGPTGRAGSQGRFTVK